MQQIKDNKNSNNQFHFILFMFLLIGLFIFIEVDGDLNKLVQSKQNIQKHYNIFRNYYTLNKCFFSYEKFLGDIGYLSKWGYYRYKTIVWVKFNYIKTSILLILISIILRILYIKGREYIKNNLKPKLGGREKKEKLFFKQKTFNFDCALEKYKNRIKENKLFLGYDATKFFKKPVFISDKIRTRHVQILGKAGTGKTEGTTLPTVLQDALKGYPVVLVDGKGELSFCEKLNYYLNKLGLGDKFYLFSMNNKEISCTFNPIHIWDGLDPTVISETFFSAYKGSEFASTEEYYLARQRNFFSMAFNILVETGMRFNISDLIIFLKNQNAMDYVKQQLKKSGKSIMSFLEFEEEVIASGDRYRKDITSFLDFLKKFNSPQFNSYEPDIDLLDIILNNKIVYFQLPINMYAMQAQLIGRIVQTNMRLISALIQAEKIKNKNGNPFKGYSSVFFEEFKGFADVSFLNTLAVSRSANMMVTASSQTINDLNMVEQGLGDSIKAAVGTKFIFCQSDSKFCEAIAKDIGTRQTLKVTERSQLDWFVDEKTGEGSVVEVEEFILHPNRIKTLAEVGQFILIRDNKKLTVVNAGFLPNKKLSYIKPDIPKKGTKGLDLQTRFYRG